jgi:hypothetical protein
MSYPSVRTYPNGPCLVNGKELADAAFGWQGIDQLTGLTAEAGGTQALATQLNPGMNHIAVSAGAADGCKLPAAKPGTMCWVANLGASSIQVFTQETSGVVINATAGSTGVTQNNGVTALYACLTAGIWTRLLSA